MMETTHVLLTTEALVYSYQSNRYESCVFNSLAPTLKVLKESVTFCFLDIFYLNQYIQVLSFNI